MNNTKKSIGVIGGLKWIYPYIKAYRGWFIVSVISTISLISINLYKAYFTQLLVNTALNGQRDSILPMIVIFIGVIMGGVLSNYTKKFATSKFALHATEDIKNALAKRISRATLEEINKIQSGDMAARLNTDTEMISSFIKNNLTNFVVQILMGLGAATYIYVVSWKLFAICLLATPFAMAFANYVNKKAALYYPKSYQYQGEASGHMSQCISGIDVVKAYNLNDTMDRKAKNIFEMVFKFDMMSQKYNSILQPLCYFLSNFPRLMCILYGGYLVVRGELQVGEIIAALQLFEYIVIPTVLLPFFISHMNRAIASINRIEEVLKMPQESTDGLEVIVGEAHQMVKFDGVSFGYDKSNTVLNSISFELKKSQLTALVGASGNGKSTIASLISGLYRHYDGKIEVFGQDIKELQLQSLREVVTVVSQDVYLFPGTIAENILYGKLDASIDEVTAAAKQASAHEFILNLKDGYNTLVGEGGAGLLGGQRQRISIARAILRNSPIIILDEPTSALDNSTELQIQKSIENLTKGRTVLVIAHRLSTIAKVDNILVLDQGKIVEEGTHQQLMDKEEYYYRLFSCQQTA